MVNDFSGPLVSRDILFSWYTMSQFLPSPEWFGSVFRCTCSAWDYQSHSEPHHPAQNAKMVWAGPERRCVKHWCIGMTLFQQLIHPPRQTVPDTDVCVSQRFGVLVWFLVLEGCPPKFSCEKRGKCRSSTCNLLWTNEIIQNLLTNQKRTFLFSATLRKFLRFVGPVSANTQISTISSDFLLSEAVCDRKDI